MAYKYISRSNNSTLEMYNPIINNITFIIYNNKVVSPSYSQGYMNIL